MDVELITAKPDEDAIKKEQSSVRRVQPTENKTTKDNALTIKQLTVKQTDDSYRCEALTQVGLRELDFYVQRNGLPIQTPEINVSPQKVDPVSLRESSLHTEHYLPIFEHSDEPPMYDAMRSKFLWPQIESDVYQSISSFAICGLSCKTLDRKRHWHLFPGSRPLEFIAMDILGQSLRTKNGKKLSP